MPIPPAILPLLAHHDAAALPRAQRLWAYYRNPVIGRSGHDDAARVRLAQEQGLPPRLTGGNNSSTDDRASRATPVIENDIAWRLHAMVDFMFGAPITIVSLARDQRTRRAVESTIDAVLEASGGAAMLQDAALLAAVFGHVDLILRTHTLFNAIAAHGSGGDSGPLQPPGGGAAVEAAARALRVEPADARRAIPLLHDADYRRLRAMVLRVRKEERAAGAYADAPARLPSGPPAPGSAAPGGGLLHRLFNAQPLAQSRPGDIIELLTADRRRVYDGERLVLDQPNPLREIPVAHVQNISQPLRWEGLSEVEPLIPLQDELNTRLSDRAYRVTMQSFKMYLAKGMSAFDGGGQLPAVSPGQVWTTDNPDAQITAFGGDADSPSETAHIAEIRQAMDKASGVTPIAAGVIHGRIGQLSSENALRITMMGLLAKTARKRVAFSRGIADVARLALKALDTAGVLRTAPQDRAIRVEWPEALPLQERERLETALIKQQLGVPPERILAELGYAPTDPGVT